MNSAQFPCIELPREWFAEAGVFAYGVSEPEMVDSYDLDIYGTWLRNGEHGEMSYMERYSEVRSDPRLLLPGVKSLISCAFSYYSGKHHRYIASYALGSDYHEVIRGRLEKVASRIKAVYGGETRVCVDTAPLRERYWAVRSGVGFSGLNGHLIVPGAGSYFFLGEVLCTVAVRPTSPLGITRCEGCGKCVRACPAQALRGDGSVDARKCLSYLTIEYRGEFDADTCLHGRLYGCDICAAVCPYNSVPPLCTVEELLPRPEVMSVTPNDVVDMTQTDFSRIFSHSAIKRAKLAGLQRNAHRLLKESGDSCHEK